MENISLLELQIRQEKQIHKIAMLADKIYCYPLCNDERKGWLQKIVNLALNAEKFFDEHNVDCPVRITTTALYSFITESKNSA